MRERRVVSVLVLCALFASAAACDDAETAHHGDAALEARDGDDVDARDAAAARDDASHDAGASQDARSADARVDERDARAEERDARVVSDARADASELRDAGASGCQALDALFCEDFEREDAGTLRANARFQPVASMATLTVEEGRARGQKALHVHTQSNGFGYLALKNFAPPGNSFYGRMHVYVAELPSAPSWAHYTLVEAAGTSAGVIRPIGGQFAPSMGNFLGAGTDQGPTGDWTNWKTSAPFKAAAWVCLTFQLDASDNLIRIAIDGVDKPDLTVSTKKHGGTQVDFVFPTFNKLWFGWWLYQGGSKPEQFDVWLDDLAIASTPLGC